MANTGYCFGFVFVISVVFLAYSSCHAHPHPQQSGHNPNSEYEIIGDGHKVYGIKPIIVPVTRTPLIINTPPPAPANSKTFVYDPATMSWTSSKKSNSETKADDDVLTWNQSNDKWLTKSTRDQNA